MSRHTAIVRLACPNEQHEHIPCDGVHVDQGGDLHIQATRHGDVQTVARFQHGHWASYALEETPGPDVDEWLREGVVTREEFLGRVRGEFADDSAEAPVKAERLPEVGEMVHIWRPDDVLGGCAPLRVAEHRATPPGVDTVLILDGPLPWTDDVVQWLTQTHDETCTEVGSWHWPCGDDQDAAPEPEKPAPLTMTINVSGSVLSQRDLRDEIQKQMLRLAQLNPIYFRR